MQSTVAVLNSWSDSWSALIVAMVWQSTLLVLLVAALARMLRRASPAVRYWLWQIVAIKLLLVPIWTVSLPVPWLPRTASTQAALIAPSPLQIPPAPIANHGLTPPPAHDRPAADSRLQQETPVVVASAATAPAVVHALRWTTWLMLGWLAVVVAQVFVILWQRRCLSRLLCRAESASPELETLVAISARGIGLVRVPRVVIVDEQCSPFVCGVLRPLVVLPRTIDSLVPREQLAPVLIHELAHVQRRDLFWNWVPQIARMLYFFHPVAHWVAFRTRLEAELACDGWAMTTTGSSAGAYADLLVRVVSHLSEPTLLRSGSVASAGLDGRQSLAERIPVTSFQSTAGTTAHSSRNP